MRPFSIFVPDAGVLSEAIRKPFLCKLSPQTCKALSGSNVHLCHVYPHCTKFPPPSPRVCVSYCGQGQGRGQGHGQGNGEGREAGAEKAERQRPPGGADGQAAEEAEAEEEAEAGSAHAHAAPAVLSLNRAAPGRHAQPCSLLLPGGERGSGAPLPSGTRCRGSGRACWSGRRGAGVVCAAAVTVGPGGAVPSCRRSLWAVFAGPRGFPSRSARGSASPGAGSASPRTKAFRKA